MTGFEGGCLCGAVRYQSKADPQVGRDGPDRETATPPWPDKGIEHGASRAREAEPEPPARGRSIDIEMGL